jgi:putative phosphoesterase
MRNPTLLVIADTHGSADSLAEVLRWAEARHLDSLAFLGDGAADLPLAEARSGFSAPRKAVRGNGDFDTKLPAAALLEFAGHAFYLTHGHYHRVGDGYASLIAAAAASGADAVLFGHTHVPFWEEAGGMLLLNPGSLGRPRTRVGPTFATIECPPNEWFKIRFWGLADGPFGKAIRELEAS